MFPTRVSVFFFFVLLFTIFLSSSFHLLCFLPCFFFCCVFAFHFLFLSVTRYTFDYHDHDRLCLCVFHLLWNPLSMVCVSVMRARSCVYWLRICRRQVWQKKNKTTPRLKYIPHVEKETSFRGATPFRSAAEKIGRTERENCTRITLDSRQRLLSRSHWLFCGENRIFSLTIAFGVCGTIRTRQWGLADLVRNKCQKLRKFGAFFRNFLPHQQLASFSEMRKRERELTTLKKCLVTSTKNV